MSSELIEMAPVDESHVQLGGMNEDCEVGTVYMYHCSHVFSIYVYRQTSVITQSMAVYVMNWSSNHISHTTFFI